MHRSPQAIAIGCLLASAPARADHTSLHATVTGDVAASDNAFSAPDNRQPDMILEVRPGLLYAYDAPRMIHELIAEADILEYISQSDNPSFNERVGWRGFFTPGPLSELTLGATGGTGQINALSSGTSPDQTGIAVTPVGRVDLRQADGNEYLSYTLTRATRLSQGAYGRWASTDDHAMLETTTNSVDLGASLAYDHSFDHDTLAIGASASFLYLERVSQLPPGPQGSRLDKQINPQGSLTWRHDLSKKWSSNLEGGLVYVHPFGVDPYNPTDVRHGGLFPTFGGLVAYTDVWGRATLSAKRSIAPNLLIAENTLSDSVIAQLALPLPWLDDHPHLRSPKLVGLGSLGIERSQLLDPSTGTLLGEIRVAHVDLGAAWSPHPGQTYGVRYEFLYQHGDSTAASMIVNPSFYRNTLFFTFALRYPERIAANVPRRTESLRSDRKDLAPVGAEPVVPDPTEEQPEGQEGDER